MGLQGFYEHINGASILEFLKKFLTHEDPNMRAKTCSALGNMCRHSSYFYGSLVSTDHISIWYSVRNKMILLGIHTQRTIVLRIICSFSLFNLTFQARSRIISLLIDRCSDPDKRTRKFACFAVRTATNAMLSFQFVAMKARYYIEILLGTFDYCTSKKK